VYLKQSLTCNSAAAGLLCAFVLVASARAGGGCLEIRGGYFWDPNEARYFIPRGIAYQTWNPPVGANQSFAQLDYDLAEFKKMYANSVRCEFVWNQVQPKENEFDFSKPDHLVEQAEKLGLKLFVLIGFQYAPEWFPNEWKAINDVGSNSVVLNYEHPAARRAYTNYISQVTAKYRTNAAIGGWILGNEYAYFDLWEPSRRYLGYDTNYSIPSFRQFLASNYHGDISALNNNWLTQYPDFDSVVMPRHYPPDRNNPGFHDLLQWRKQSIADYVAVGAAAAKAGDTNHLLTYSMIGGIFGEADAHYTCEDAKVIVARCAEAGAKLDFWSINNYALTRVDTELRSVAFGIGKHKAESGLPVMVSETGLSSTDGEPDQAGRQSTALTSLMWESLLSGAIGTHIFTWNDRSQYSLNYFYRERGFGIVNENRTIKVPVYSNVLEMFRQMENIRIEQLLGGSTNPPPDVQFFWSTNADMGWPRANHENNRLWSVLNRLGYQPGIIDDEQFERGDFTNAPALILSRCYQMNPAHLDRIATEAISAGINVHASSDLPGQFNAYHHTNANWANHMSALFGLGVTNAVPGWDSWATNFFEDNHRINLKGVRSLGALSPAYTGQLQTWKIWHEIKSDSGQTVVTHTGDRGTKPPMPALQIKTIGRAKTAINTFALGDAGADNQPPLSAWDLRFDWLRAVYRSHFGMIPPIDLTGTGASYVSSDYRICSNGSILLSLVNQNTAPTIITLGAPGLLTGKTVENLTSGGIIETNSDGFVDLSLIGDEFVLLYAYPNRNGKDDSLVNPNPAKIWFDDAPTAVWPNGLPYGVQVGYDTRGADSTLFASFESVRPSNKTYARSAGASVTGTGTRPLPMLIPDADLNDPDYVSTPDGGAYIFHAWLEQGGALVSETHLPVRLLWGARPQGLPQPVQPGQTYLIPVEWEELPSYASGDPTPLSRAALWDSLSATQHYNVVLELIGGSGQVLASATNVTADGSGTNLFSIVVPPAAQGPFSWSASLRTAPRTGSLDVSDSFEGRDRGLDRSPMYPWFSYVYPDHGAFSPDPGGVTKLGEGIRFEPGRAANKVAYMVVTNAPAPGALSGFGIVRGTNEWALPDPRLWSNYLFSCDFKEIRGPECSLQLQLKDVNGNWIEFNLPYTNGPGQWERIEGSLDRFVQGPTATFDPQRVREFVVNVQMYQTNAIYEAYFDNIRFVGPPDLEDTFEDRQVDADLSRIGPWQAYGYDAPGHNDVLLAKGIQLEASDGSQSAFVVAWNRTDSGNFAGFGMFRVFDTKWALPADTSQWKDYSISFDFKEESGHPCLLEIQLKNLDDLTCGFRQRGRHYTNAYAPNIPDRDGWQTITTTLDPAQFTQPEYFCDFDPSSVFALVLNVQMLEKSPVENVVYVGYFDNIRFSAPETLAPGESIVAVYTSTNDFFGFKSIGLDEHGKVVLTWLGGGALEEADALDETWSKVLDAPSPATLDVTSGNRFYRLRR
jgi:hypothetical protein